jgi:hypothetical protein
MTYRMRRLRRQSLLALSCLAISLFVLLPAPKAQDAFASDCHLAAADPGPQSPQRQSSVQLVPISQIRPMSTKQDRIEILRPRFIGRT